MWQAHPLPGTLVRIPSAPDTRMSNTSTPHTDSHRARALIARLALIVALALALRTAIFMGRLTNDPNYTNWTTPSDQSVYIEQAHDLLRGGWPNGVFWFQPGNVV